MHKRGIVAVGDISNGPETFLLKSKTAIAYHTFIELLTPFGANLEQRTKAAINHGIDLYRQAQNLHLPASLAPHAPYTITGNLLTEIIQFNAQNNSGFCNYCPITKSAPPKMNFIYKAQVLFPIYMPI